MKKIFKLTDEKKHEDRVLESVKNDIRKYVKREKKKNLSDKATKYWDFDCKIGTTASDAKVVEYEELIKALDTVKTTGAKEAYVEILSKEVTKPIKIEEDTEDTQ
jgi:CRISPR/Cas system-associated protein Cas5 (RAMP superfamily)